MEVIHRKNLHRKENVQWFLSIKFAPDRLQMRKMSFTKRQVLTEVHVTA